MKRLVIISLCIAFLFCITNISFAAPSFKVNLIYKIEQGDTLFDLAREFDVSLEKIKKASNLTADEVIKIGDKIVIPEVDSLELTSKEKKDNRLALYNPKDTTEEYKLNCDQQYNVKINQTKTKAKVNVSHLKTLKYYVRSGDNLYDLAREFKTNVAVLKELNDLGESNVIRLGDKIKLPINNLSAKEVIYHTISDKEFEILVRLIHGEARGESYIGQVAVGAVVLNRVISSYFPDNIRDVIYQPGQFSPVANGQINLRPNRTAYRAARAALQGQDPTRGACYFYNPQTARHMWWFKSREVVVKIGNHVFAR